ncbi:hypothetical protein RHSIM_RhsimUnG0026200 [Rhododendron simsii]|uniref:F-box associated domain-containing protein n=1 Tax=Rhododendron simsii TaxID=118357 RepID=A0A834FZG9_RHOSS|nr:hypothetical protein RHSIM_RhsimUnG0026200 [Rhododendron simsii]
MCKFYIPNEGIWQELGLVNLGARNIKFDCAIYHKDALHILSDWFPFMREGSDFCWPYIVAFDPEKGTSRFMKIPEAARKCDFGHPNFKMGLFKWSKGNEESICLVTLSKRVFTTWAMVDYDAGLWIRINKVRALAMGMVEPDPEIAGFTVLNGDSLLIATEKCVYRYCLTGDWEGKRAEKVCENGCGANIFKLDFQPEDREIPVVGESIISEWCNRLSWGKFCTGSEDFSLGLINDDFGLRPEIGADEVGGSSGGNKL